jgi:hypothetical protein
MTVIDILAVGVAMRHDGAAAPKPRPAGPAPARQPTDFTRLTSHSR